MYYSTTVFSGQVHIYVAHPVKVEVRGTKSMSVYSGVARICCEEGQRGKLCHRTLMMDFRAGCSSCSMT